MPFGVLDCLAVTYMTVKTQYAIDARERSLAGIGMHILGFPYFDSNGMIY